MCACVYRTLYDSFEWHEGLTLKFGLYSLDTRTQKRTLRDGSKYYQRICERFADKTMSGYSHSSNSRSSAGASDNASNKERGRTARTDATAAHASYHDDLNQRNQARGSSGSSLSGSQLVLR